MGKGIWRIIYNSEKIYKTLNIVFLGYEIKRGRRRWRRKRSELLRGGRVIEKRGKM